MKMVMTLNEVNRIIDDALKSGTMDIQDLEEDLLLFEDRYKRSDNPLCAWEAFRFAKRFALPIPDWVLDYLYHSADKLLNISGGLGDKTQAAIAEALQLKTDGVGSQFKRLQDLNRNIWMTAVMRRWLKNCPPRTVQEIKKDVAQMFNISVSNVEKIYKKFSK